MASVVTWADVVYLGRRAARHFKLSKLPVDFEPFSPRSRTRIDGRCHVKRALIMLRLHRVGKPHQSLGRSTIMATLAHELAHLRDLDHGPQHGNLTREIADWLRTQGQPVSHKLFDGVGRNPLKPRKTQFSYAWKRPKPRRRKRVC